MQKQPDRLINQKRATDIMLNSDIDIIIGTGYVNYGYISGYFTHFGRDYPGPLYNGLPLVRFAGMPCDKNIPPFLVTYPGEEGDIHVQKTLIEDRRFWGPKYKAPGRNSKMTVAEDPYQSLREALEERGLSQSNIGLSMSELNIETLENIRKCLPDATLVDASKHFNKIRMIKTSEEIRRIRLAVNGAERGHKAVQNNLKPGMSQLELSAIVKRAVIDDNTDRYIIHVSSGKYGSFVLAPSEDIISKNTIVSVDVGSLYRDYCGDMFRVYALGKAPKQALEIHSQLDEVNAILLKSLKPGILASDLYTLGRLEMEKRGLELALDFVGHSLGIDVHEPPYLVANDHTILESNMIIVLEVATRIENIGHLCAEITCLITNQGCEILNTIPYSITHIQ